jgi:hypothetical protein
MIRPDCRFFAPRKARRAWLRVWRKRVFAPTGITTRQEAQSGDKMSDNE